jgi:hypothetical protein
MGFPVSSSEEIEDTIPCSLKDIYRSFNGILEYAVSIFKAEEYTATLKMEKVCFSETSINIYQTTLYIYCFP